MDLTLNGVSYAYLGDAYYELYIRKHLLSLGYTNGNILHKHAVLYTSGKAQASIVNYFLENDILNIDEVSMYKHGRNSAQVGRKNIDPKTYQQASGFEALIGRLSIENEKRAIELIQSAIKLVEGGMTDGKAIR